MRFESGLWFFEQFQIFKKIKKNLPHVLLGPDVYAVTDPEEDSDEGEDADEATGAESSSDEGEDAGPESSNDETRIGSRFQ